MEKTKGRDYKRKRGEEGEENSDGKENNESNPLRKQRENDVEEVQPPPASLSTHAMIRFKSLDGTIVGPSLSLPLSSTVVHLNDLLNDLLKNEEKLPYSFFLNEEEVLSTLHSLTSKMNVGDIENALNIIYQPQAIFRVKSVTRCAATIPGHSEAVLSVAFSPDGSLLATGSGDCTVRVWDVLTSTPKSTLRGHSNWVLAVEFSPNQRCIASGGMDGELRVWGTDSGTLVGKPLKGHSKWISAIQYEPFHLNPKCCRLATSSKDGTVKIWDLTRRLCQMTLSGHTAAVQSIRWGGGGVLFSASQDKTIKVWDTSSGKLIRSLEGHAHWINHIALSSAHLLKSSYFDRNGHSPEGEEEKIAVAKKKYEDFIASQPSKSELLVSCSDDFTLNLWDPLKSKKSLLRMTGHQQAVNFVCFSPDGLLIASASFDKSVKIWSGVTGKFITSFRGHVQAVYQCCWSPDSRLLCSSSKDSTMKVWDIRKKKMAFDLPGHADEVFACDWSPNGEIVASGGKDHVVKIWRH